MTTISNRSSVLALVKESTEGTPVAPTSATTNYLPLQNGFKVAPAFKTLENAEMTGSKGKAKQILGGEAPTFTLSHYLKHGGTEGAEPNMGVLLEALMGAKSVASTEYNTIAGSTVGSASAAPILKVDAAEGLTFEKGEAVLIKNSLGYEVRNIKSIATDDLTLNFNLDAASVALGTNLGKAVLYKPADDGHPTLTSWIFRGNGGATELVAGCRVTACTISANAGEFINASFDIGGIGYYFNPIEITSSSKYIDFNDGGVKAAQVTTGMYKDPLDLASAIQTAMQTLSTDTITCTYSSTTGKFTIASNGAAFSLLWNTGANTANTIAAKIGFSAAADDTAALTYTSDNAISFAAPQVPVYESTQPNVAKANQVLFGTFSDKACFQASKISIKVADTKTDLMSVCSASGIVGSIVSERMMSIDLTARLDKFDAEKFKKYRSGDNIEFAYTVGEKSGGNWVPGKVVNCYCPTSTITSYSLEDNAGIVELNMTISAYVSGTDGEFYINYL